jgi:TRAP-type C4-dicarboxylate transport system permease small subunit
LPFTWIEKVRELSLAWLTLIGAAIGIRSRSHSRSRCSSIDCPQPRSSGFTDLTNALITGFGLLAAWCGFTLCLLNHAPTTHSLEIKLPWLYASSVVGGILVAVYGFTAMISRCRNTGPSTDRDTSCCLRQPPSSSLRRYAFDADRVRARYRRRREPVVGGYPINSFPRRWYRDRRAGVLLAIPAFVFAA